jgi:LEA14-like dessication related protein
MFNVIRNASLPSVLGVMMLLMLGCGSVQRPTASFRSMAVSDVSARGFLMNVDVDVANPNSVALPLTNVDYGVSLGGVRVVDGGKINPEASIPANGHSTITIPVPLTFEHLLSAEEAIRKGGGDVTYGLDAGLNFDTGLPVIGVQRVPLQHEGTLKVKELLQKNWSTILTSPAAKELAQKVLGGFLKF